jgi:hypothetical protein
LSSENGLNHPKTRTETRTIHEIEGNGISGRLALGFGMVGWRFRPFWGGKHATDRLAQDSDPNPMQSVLVAMKAGFVLMAAWNVEFE